MLLVRRFLRAFPLNWTLLRRSVLIGLSAAGVLIVLWAGQFFVSARLQGNDVYIIPNLATDTIRLIALDDASFERYGRSLNEWDRTVFADLITWLTGAGARVITLDILFNQSTAADELLIEAIRAARSSDARVRTVLPVIGEGIDLNRSNDQQLYYTGAIRPAEQIAAAADYLGAINVFPDADNAVRRQISHINTHSQSFYSLAIASYLAYLRVPSSAASQLIVSGDGTFTIGADRVLSVDENGFWLPNYFRNPDAQGDGIYPAYSLADVLDGAVDPAVFADKIVLIGTLNASAVTDLYDVPVSPNGRRIAGVEIHAHTIETLIQNLPLYPQSAFSELAIIVVLAVVSSIIYGQLRWYSVLIVSVGIIALWLLFVFASFSFHRIQINLTTSIWALSVPMVITLISDFAQEVRQRRNSEFLLNSVVDVSQQQMALDRVLPRVGEDLRRLCRANMVVIWLPDHVSGALLPGYAWTADPALSLRDAHDIADYVRQARKSLFDSKWIGIPVLWQGRILAIFTSRRGADLRMRTAPRQMIEALALQIAPSLDNALLFAQVRRQNTLLEAVFAGSPAGLMVLDSDLHLSRASGALDAAFGVLCADYLGRPLNDLFTGAEVADEVGQIFQQHLRSWTPFREQISHRRLTLIVDAAPLIDTGEWVIVFNDVTSLAQLSELKTRMIRMASHDLNNPLTNVIATAEIMLDPEFGIPMDASTRNSMERIRRNSHHMRQIIEDILSLERARGRSMIKEQFDYGLIVQEVCARLADDAALKHQQFEVDLEPDRAPINGDQGQLRQVAQNLISNAIKYTPEGGAISVRLINDVDRLLLEVEDSGYGIPESSQSRIFQEFFRAKSSVTASISGTGLGLSLVKSVVSAHGGRVWFRSIEGEGSTFFVELPFAEGE